MSTSSPGGAGASSSSLTGPKQNSDESLATSEDYEVISAPKDKNSDNDSNGSNKVAPDSSKESSQPKLDIVVGEGKETDLQANLDDCLKSSPPPEESTPDGGKTEDGQNAEEQEEEQGDDGTTFHNVWMLGCLGIRVPKDEATIQNQIAQLNADEQNKAKRISLSVPHTSDGQVVIREQRQRPSDIAGPSGPIPASAAPELVRFPVCQIIFFARGNADTQEAACFAFTTIVIGGADKSKGDGVAEGQPHTRFETHVFRCQVPEAVSKVFVSFAQAFKRTTNPTSLGPAESYAEQEAFLFELTLEVRERDDSKKGGGDVFDAVPRQKGVFKLRSGAEKKVIITVRQISRHNSCLLTVERCFGMLVSPGRNVRHADMQLLEQVTMATTSANFEGQDQQQSQQGNNSEAMGGGGGIAHVITGAWDPSETAFAVLNRETPTDVQSVYVTVAADLVISQVAEPVRFVVETRCRIHPPGEKYWYYTRKNLCKQYQVRLKRRKVEEGQNLLYDLCGIDVSEEIERGATGRLGLTMQLANNLSVLSSTLAGSLGYGQGSSQSYDGDSIDLASPVRQEDEDDSGGEETVLSGFGDVSKDCSGTELEQWSQLLSEWDTDNPLNFPKHLNALVWKGVPEALRGEVWQRVTGATMQMDDIIETYRVLVTKESPDEKVILRDIHRTFPAHEFFKEAGGVGQESLYRISKAYSVYDSEVGYCQGQSFLIAALLLQMPEEQAFGVLVKVMHRWTLRDMFKENFEQLQLRLYQLDRLVETNMPDMWQHFQDNGLESHMYASQWFLTVFTAKFPLFLVFRVLDVFLISGFDSIFQVALAILKVSKRDLSTLDFEGLMRYFRVNVPKRYRSEENAKHLMAVARTIKLKRMKKYEKEWIAIRDAERAREDPAVRFERENKKLQSDVLRLDTENDNLARQLLNDKIEMRKEIDKAEDEKERFEKEATSCKLQMEEALEERRRLQEENEQLKQLLKRETERLDAELAAKVNVIAEYKEVANRLGEKLERAQAQLGATPADPASCAATNTATATAGNKGEEVAETNLDSANDRIRELELELAQTKLALVETECKNQDLAHQFSSSNQAAAAGGGMKGTWLSKTLSSIKETAAHAQQSAHMTRQQHKQQGSNPQASSITTSTSASEAIKKSTSVDALRD